MRGFSIAALSPTRMVSRRLALILSFAVLWLAVGPSVGAAYAAAHQPRPKGHTRKLNAVELNHISGAQLSGGGSSYISAPTPTDTGIGPAFPWEPSGGGTNLITGNHVTALPLVQWPVKGGRLQVNFTLYHNSQSTFNGQFGQHWSHSYNICITAGTGDVELFWGNGQSYSFVQNLDGSYSAPAGIYDTLVGTTTDGVTTYTLTTKNQTVYTFVQYADSGGTWWCSSIADRNGNTITLNRDGGGNLDSVVDPTGRTLSITYGFGGETIASISDPLSRTFSFSYDDSGNLSSVTMPEVGSTCYSVSYGYDSSHDIVSMTDLRSKTSTYGYVDGELISETDPLSNETTYSYLSGYTTVTDPRGHSVTEFYNDYSQVTQAEDQLGDSQYYSAYDANNNCTTFVDKRGKYWYASFDSRGNRLTATDPLSHETVWTYSSFNDPLTVTTDLGHETVLGYDGSGNLVSVTDPLSHEVTLTRDSYGEVTAVTSALDETSYVYYNSNGDVDEIVDPLSHSVSMTRDALGQVTEATDPTGYEVSTSRDALERVTSVTAPGDRVTTYTYSGGSGLVASITDPMSRVYTNTFDDAGRLVGSEDPNSHSVHYVRDANGNCVEFEDGNSHYTDYSFSYRNELTGISYPDSTSESFSYFATGQPYQHTDGRGITSTASLDDAGRVTGVSYSDSTPSVSFTYDADNRNTQMTSGDGTTYYTFDNAGRLTERDSPEGTVEYSYRNDNSLYVRTLAGIGTSTYSYDDAGRPTSVAVPGISGSESTGYTYDAAGRMLTTTFANGDVETDAFDSTTADLDSVTHATSGGSTIASYSYSHDSDGRVTQETLADGSYYSYGFDYAGQLTSESLNSGGSGTLGALHGYSYTYSYDAAGNRATRYNGTSTDTYSYDAANKLTSVGTKSYSYDDAGNCTSVYNSATSDTVTLAYDGASRMISASDSASTFSDTYSYNGLSQRVGKVDNTGTFSNTLDSDAIDATVLADGAATYNYGANGNALISENRGGASKYYHSDGLGSTTALTNSSESTTDTRLTDSFGSPITGSGSTPTPFGFGGQSGYQADADTGLKLCGARYYDSSAGRFLSRDPALSGTNWYTYCGNDPVDGIDPTGLTSRTRPSAGWITSTLPLPPPAGWNGGGGNTNWLAITGGLGLAGVGIAMLPGGPLADLLAGLGLGSVGTAGAAEGGGAAIAAGGAADSAIAGEAAGGEIAANTSLVDAGGGAAGGGGGIVEGGEATGGTLDGGEQAIGGGCSDTPASTPIGRSGSPMYVPRGTNSPAVISGIQYSGHALDQMQCRGIMPSVVQDAIENGNISPGKYPNTISASNGQVKVIVNPTTGLVITAIPQ